MEETVMQWFLMYFTKKYAKTNWLDNFYLIEILEIKN